MRALAIVLTVLVASAAARAAEGHRDFKPQFAFESGAALHEACAGVHRIESGNTRVEDAYPIGLCQGFITGAFDGLVASNPSLYCIPDNMTAGQIEAMVIRDIDAEPQLWNEPATNLVYKTISDHFMCH